MIRVCMREDTIPEWCFGETARARRSYIGYIAGTRRADDSEQSQIGCCCSKPPSLPASGVKSFVVPTLLNCIPLLHIHHTFFHFLRPIRLLSSRLPYWSNRIVAAIVQIPRTDSFIKPWLSNSRARRPSCSTRRRSMPQRLLLTLLRRERTASTLAADLRLPVATRRDTVSLLFALCLPAFLPFPHLCHRSHLPLHGRTRLPADTTTVCMHSFISSTSTHSITCSSCCATSSDATHTIQSNTTQHMRHPTPRAVTFQQGLCNG